MKEDPVESGWGASDPRDSDYYLTDLPYGDLNGDGLIDAAVGRLPADPELAEAMLDRSDRRGKDAFVASAYLHDSWPGILASRGGGMWGGKLLGTALQRQGYTVDRAVEHRADTQEFLAQLSPHGVNQVVRDTKTVQGVASRVAGKTAGNAAAALFATVTSLRYAEQAFEQYLEHDWGTAGFDRDRARDRIDRTGTRPAELVRRTVAAVGVAGVPAVLRSAGFAATAGDLVYTYLWPDRYPRLTRSAVRDGIADTDTVYYLGAGNGSAWLLPDGAAVAAREVPETDARIVFDASTTAARNGSDPRLWRAFLEQGATAYVGSSAVTYAPFTTELAHRFATRGHTVGEALRLAVNGMATDSLAWPDPETLVHHGARGKMLRSFILWGDPTARKDPVAPPDRWETHRECNGTRCTATFTVEPTSTVVDGTRRIEMPADGRILRAGTPQIPLFKTRLGLPVDADVLDTDVDTDTREVTDVTVPTTRLAAHGGDAPAPPERDGTFPEDRSRVAVRRAADGRTVLDIAHAGLQYDAGTRTATVMARITVTATYRTPLDLAVAVPGTASAGNTTLAATVWSRESRNATLHLRTANATTVHARSVPVTLRAGRTVRSVDVPLPSPGNWSVTAYLRADGHTAGPRTAAATVVPGAPHPAAVAAPGTVDEGDRFTTAVTVANPLPTARTVTVGVAGRAGVQPAFMEPGERTVTVPGNGTRTVAVPMRAYADGPAAVTATAGDLSRTAHLAVADRTLIDSARTAVTGSTFATRTGITVGDGTATWTGEDAVLRTRVRGRNRTTTLATGTWTVRTAAGRTGTRRTLETPAGRVSVRLSGGDRSLVRRGNVSAAALASRTAVLRRELRKLHRIIVARDGTGPAHPGPWYHPSIADGLENR